VKRPLVIEHEWQNFLVTAGRVDSLTLDSVNSADEPCRLSSKLWVNLGDGACLEIDQAASFWLASMPSVNLMPVIIFGNWFPDYQ
jgi:hypothetical protein